MAKEKKRGAAFIDRDGTINVEVNYLHEPEKAVILPGVAEALDLIHAHGYLAVVVTNQAGIAKGMYGEAEMRAVHPHAELRSCGECCIAQRHRGAEGIRTGGQAPSPPAQSPRLCVSARKFF